MPRTSAALKIENNVPDEIIAGLNKEQKTLPSKYFYDEKGSRLFDEITRLEEYYPTRTEQKIMEDNIKEIVSVFRNNSLFIELGSGSSKKTRVLLDNLHKLAAYVPVDISEEFLLESASRLQTRYPELKIIPVAADYTSGIDIPSVDNEGYRVVYFPGSTIGNFTKEEAVSFIEQVAGICYPGSSFIIGTDLVKDKSVLEAAYNDKRGVTAEFNLNILDRMNYEFGFDFKRENFRHLAVFNEKENRIEMHLESTLPHEFSANGYVYSMEKGETILTEYSHKYTEASFRHLCEKYFTVEQVWTDENNYFSVRHLVAK